MYTYYAMLKFNEYNLESTSKLLPFIQSSPYQCSDITLGYLAMWKEELAIRYAIWNDTLIIQQDIDDQASFSYPFGKDPDGMIDELISYALENHLPIRFFALTEELIEKLKNDSRFQTITYSYDERWSDYIYNAETAATFSGKKFSGQRNHVNKFKKLFGEPNVVPLSDELLPKVHQMLEHYKEEHQDGNALEYLELERTIHLLDHYKEFNQYGACLLLNDEVIAFSLGEVVKDMLVIHVEKALRNYQGIYPTMYQSFVRLVKEKVPTLSLINREDDSGDLGLRTSKLQYQPIDRIHKYFAHMNSPIEKVTWEPIKTDTIYLTKMEPKDRIPYYALSVDTQTNRWWGYDYLSDVNITGPIDENTFYDFMDYDMSVGDSINFAIRESVDGDLIGEVILWHFTHNEEAEIGCRLCSHFHGHGYGNDAFLAAVNYCENVLHLTPYARCYKENETSYKMILHSGLKLFQEDDEFYYFKK